jgi:hypothetical protein
MRNETQVKSQFKRSDLLKLFLTTAFPLHVWTIVMALRDIGWVAEGRTISGAIGFSAYVLLYTLFESLLLWGFLLLLGLLISRKWSKGQRLSALGSVAILLAGWSILEQIILVLYLDKMINFLGRFAFLAASPWIGIAALGLLVTASFALPLFLVLRSPKLSNKLNAFFDRLNLLSGMYLFFDAVAIIIIIIRNIF